MEFTDADLEHLERLARIRLAGASRENLREQLGRIIEFVRQLQAIDTAGREPRAFLGGFEAVLRGDAARPSRARDEVLGEAPAAKGDCFEVPPVIESEEP